MRHTADQALDIGMAQPARRVVCLHGDSGMLMSLENARHHRPVTCAELDCGRRRRGSGGPISRSPSEDARYLQSSSYDWSRRFRAALTKESHAIE